MVKKKVRVKKAAGPPSTGPEPEAGQSGDAGPPVAGPSSQPAKPAEREVTEMGDVAPTQPQGRGKRQPAGGAGRGAVPRGAQQYQAGIPSAEPGAETYKSPSHARTHLSSPAIPQDGGSARVPVEPESGAMAAQGPSRPADLKMRPEPRPPVGIVALPTVTKVSGAMGDMSIGERKATQGAFLGLQIPRRSGPQSCGTLGRKIMVDTNHLALDLQKLTKAVIHYDVSIEPDKPRRLLRPLMRQVQQLNYPNRNPAFDGKKNLYASSLLPFGTMMSQEIIVWDPEREREKDYKVTLKQVGTIDMSSLVAGMMYQVPQSAVQALDIILRNAPANSMVPVGRSYFSQPEGKALDLGDGMEAWIGFFQSAIVGWKPFVNIDVAHKGFPKVQDCVGVIRDLFRNIRLDQELNNFQKDDFLKYIRELKVNYMIPGQPTTKRTYRVNGIAKSSRAQEFILDDGRKTTVEEYYAKARKYRIQFPFLPCLDVGSPNREKKILVPSELCTLIGGQVVIKKMTETQTTNLIKIAATDTDDRKRKIMAALKKCNFNNDPSVQEFGLRVNDKFERIPARILEPPQLEYKDPKRPVLPSKGVWRASQFHDGKAIKKWTILSMDKYVRDDALRNFSTLLLKQARDVGMIIEPPQEPINTKIMPHETANLQEFLGRNIHLQVIFVVVQDQGPSYAKVKQMAELTVGVLTQCLKSRTLSRMNPATVGNILLKVNAKLNGVNHVFGPISKPACLKTPCMIVGADVTHPPPDMTSLPSVAAVCASHDPKAFRYNLQYRLQPARVEIIQDLENIMKQQLQFFLKQTNCKPQKIIFYRDGVSEGQFQEVLNVEFQAIRRACKSVSSNDLNYEPKITFLVVQKRHHTRFFPTKPEDSDGRNKNVPAGTIVDTIITHPTDLDFYLVSHASIQGVSRPTKYRRLWDDNNMSEDELELLTYYLCHMFTRCTRSVSYPAPTYYAHLAAYRARCYLEGMKITMSNLNHEQELRKIKEKIISGSPMFFV